MAERRNFVRIKKSLGLAYKVIIDKFASPLVPPNISHTDSISGNGLSFLCPKPIEKGTRLEMTIEITDGNEQPIDAAGEVLGYTEIGKNEYEIKVKFTEIDNPVTERLSKYIMREDVKIKNAEKRKNAK